MTRRRLEVVSAGPFTTVQDRGRPGRASWGVGRSGAADQGSAALANRLVANRPGAALLEATMGGLRVRAVGALTVALTGAEPEARVDGRRVAIGAPIALVDGAELVLGVPARGLRTYLAVRGGVRVPRVLGSRSYDVLSGLGPPPLRAGDRLEVGAEPRRWPEVEAVPTARALGPAGEPATGRVLTGEFGPHPEAMTAEATSQLGTTWWTVAPDTDRTGVRLEGPALARTATTEWPVEGLVRGAIQLPPSGRPVVLLADHPVTGGYPAIGALDEVSCDRAAQLRPGDRLRLALRAVSQQVIRLEVRQYRS